MDHKVLEKLYPWPWHNFQKYEENIVDLNMGKENRERLEDLKATNAQTREEKKWRRTLKLFPKFFHFSRSILMNDNIPSL
jgi:hypothetical protein